jgi:hypothetical protein
MATMDRTPMPQDASAVPRHWALPFWRSGIGRPFHSSVRRIRRTGQSCLAERQSRGDNNDGPESSEK